MVNPVLEMAVIRLGGVEAFTEALNGRIAEIEAKRGTEPGESRASVHPTTVRRWLQGSSPRFAVVVQAACDLVGRSAQEIWMPASVEDVNRREFLGAIGGLGAAAVTGTFLPLIAELGAAPDADPAHYERRAAELWSSCWTSDPLSLVYAASDHVDYGRTLLARSRGRDQQRISEAIGLTAILVGREAFFDLGKASKAKEVWGVAARYLSGSTDHPLLACLHGHMAFVPGWSGQWDEAAAHLELASGYARRGGGPELRSWLHAVAGECQARSKRPSEAIVAIERAKGTHADGGSDPDPWWLDYYSADRLDGFDASVGLAAAQEVLHLDATPRATRHALDRVERALGHLQTSSQLPTEYTPQDCVTALDRAIAYALINDDDAALCHAENACKALSARPYFAAAVRLDTLADDLPAIKVGQLQEIEQTYLRAA